MEHMEILFGMMRAITHLPVLQKRQFNCSHINIQTDYSFFSVVVASSNNLDQLAFDSCHGRCVTIIAPVSYY